MSIEFDPNVGKEPSTTAVGGGGSTNASDLTSGTLADARLSSGILNATYQHNQYVLTTGSGTAYVAAPTVAITLAAGAEILCGIHTTSGTSPTLNVSGTGAKSILKESAAGLVAVTAGQLVSGPNIYKFTYNAGFDAWVVSSPMPIAADDLPSHSHAASDVTSGSFNTARIADGTATAGYVPISDGDGTSTWGAPSASDSTKLALDGSNAMTNRLQFSGTQTSAGASVANIWRDSTGNLNLNVASGLSHSIFDAGTERFKLWYSVGIGRAIIDAPFNGIMSLAVNGTRVLDMGASYVALQKTLYFDGNVTPLGATYPEIYNTSTGIHHNVPNNLFHEFHEAGTGFLRLSGDYGILMDGSSQTFHPSLRNIFADSGGHLKLNCPSSVGAALCSEGGGTTYPEVMVHGLAETAYAGAIEIKAGAVAFTNNGIWTNCFSLAKGIHIGNFWVYANDGTNSTPFNWYILTELSGAQDFGLYFAYGSSHGFVAAGSASAGNIALRVSGGYIQVNVGTAMPSTMKLGFEFQGMVV